MNNFLGSALVRRNPVQDKSRRRRPAPARVRSSHSNKCLPAVSLSCLSPWAQSQSQAQVGESWRGALPLIRRRSCSLNVSPTQDPPTLTALLQPT